MIVEKITKRFTKALIAFFLKTPQLGASQCPVLEASKRTTVLLASTRSFVRDSSSSMNRRHFVQDLDAVTDLCLNLSPNKNVRASVRAVSSTFRDTVLLNEESDSEESDQDETISRLIEQK